MEFDPHNICWLLLSKILRKYKFLNVKNMRKFQKKADYI